MADRRLLVLMVLVLFGASSCNLPLGLGPLVNPDLAPTLVEQTMEALRQDAASSTPTASPLPTATPTPINTPLPVILSVSTPTWCYAGPGAGYGRVVSIAPGTSVPAVGQDGPDNYWIVEVPGQPQSVCWLTGQNTQLTGDTAALPQFPTPQPSMFTLSEPKNLGISCTSSSSTWNVVLRWTNTEPTQLGVRVYRNNRLITTLRAGARSFSEEFVHRGKRDVSYGVQAYNAVAVSSIVTIDVRRCE